jgi:hypothetical protein
LMGRITTTTSPSPLPFTCIYVTPSLFTACCGYTLSITYHCYT